MYKYDAEGRLVKSYVYDSETYLNQYGSRIYYDDQSRVSMVFNYIDYSCPSAKYHGTTYSDSSYYSYWYDTVTGNLSQLTVSGGYIRGTIKPTYDNFGRTDHKEIDFNVNSNNAFYNYLDYAYKNDGVWGESSLISQLISEIRVNSDTSVISTTTYNFAYDDNGNITQITDTSGVIQNKYYYDSLGQLIREDNRARNFSYTYTYDNAGNITGKKTYAFTTGALGTVKWTMSYGYEDSEWGDLLTSFNGDTIEYDEIGNPITIWSGASDCFYGYKLTWDGRQLVSYQNFEGYGEDDIWYDTPVTFTYNADGIRTSKTEFGTRHDYVLNGSQIISERWESGSTEYLLYYIYDDTGLPIGLKYRTSAYEAGVFDCFFFEKNLQGDVIAVYNSSGKKIGSYTYDAWGNCSSSVSSGITTIERNVVYSYNPFRYRGYYYDVQTGFYYLQSRYYNPSWGRFLNADGVKYLGANGDLQAFNLYAYCSNDPINYNDSQGTFIGIGAIIGGVIGAAAGAVAGYISATVSGGDVKMAVVSGAISGGLNGIILSSVADPAGALIAAGAVSAISMINNVVNQSYNYIENEKAQNGGTKQVNVKQLGQELKENIDWGEVAYTGIVSFAFASAGGFTNIGINNTFSNCTPGMATSFSTQLAGGISSGIYSGLQQATDMVYSILRG